MDRMLAATAAAEDTHYWFRALRRVAARLLDETLAGRSVELVVDCGAGTGRNLDWLSRYGRAIGIELTPLALRAGRSKGRPLVRGTVTALPLRAASVDVATSFDVLYCLDDQSESAALAEMFRVLKPGGVALVNAAALDLLRGSHSTLTHEVRRYTPSRLRDRLAAAGFQTERITFTNMCLFAPAVAVRGLERLTGRAAEASEADLRVPPRAVNTVLDVCLRAEAAMLRVMNLPIGTSVMAVARKPG
ncbi:MAG: methyltransferase domain-containing protein [Vicinamibacterales bacterium]